MQGGWVGWEQTAVLGREPHGCFVLNPEVLGGGHHAGSEQRAYEFVFMFFLLFVLLFVIIIISKHPSIKGPM